MSLEAALTDIVARLRQGRFPNEQSISQGVVLRVLQELGWDTRDTAVVWPEYQTGQGRADCRSRNRRSQARAAIPEAWRALLRTGNKDLVSIVADAVESRAGVRPDDEDVAEFLANLDRPVVVETPTCKTQLQPNDEPAGRKHRRMAKTRMSSRVDGGYLHVKFEGGASQRWSLPSKSDAAAIRRVRDEAVRFAKQNGASIGQINAVKKALTDAHYYVSR